MLFLLSCKHGLLLPNFYYVLKIYIFFFTKAFAVERFYAHLDFWIFSIPHIFHVMNNVFVRFKFCRDYYRWLTFYLSFLLSCWSYLSHNCSYYIFFFWFDALCLFSVHEGLRTDFQGTFSRRFLSAYLSMRALSFSIWYTKGQKPLCTN